MLKMLNWLDWNRLFHLDGTYSDPIQLPNQLRADQKSKHIIKGIV